MKIGICVVTCDRPAFLKGTMSSLSTYGDKEVIRVVVDNGISMKKQVKLLAHQFRYTYIDGDEGNSPVGQNLGFEFLQSQGCVAILKSDDDVRFESHFLPRVVKVFRERRETIGAVGGIIYSHDTEGRIRKKGNNWLDDKGNIVSPESFMRYRMQSPSSEVIKMKHLHCSFLYDVASALELKKRTQRIRGGPFGVYFSPIAFREESEFTFLLWKLLGKELILVSDAEAYHHYAPGGIRRFKERMGELAKSDESRVQAVVKNLTGSNMELVPAWL